MKKQKLSVVITFILLVVLAVGFLFPTLATFSASFMSSNEIEKRYGTAFSFIKYLNDNMTISLIPDMVSPEQYETLLLQSPTYLYRFWNSVLLVVPISVLQLVVALLAAYGFSRYRGKLRNIIFFGYIILLLMPYQVTMVPNYFVSKYLGILNTRWAIILPGIFSPFSVYLLTKEMRKIPKSYLESAQIDGANEWQIFKLIACPMIRGAGIGVLLLVFFDYWSMVEQPLILIENEDMHPLSVFLNQINESATGVAFAAAIIYLVPCLLLYLYGEEDLVAGSSQNSGIIG